MMIFFILILNFLSAFEIVQQSQNQQFCENEQVQIFVLVNEDNLNYQWFKDDILINLETNSTINFNNIKFENSGKYYCTVSNSSQTLTSDEFIINIIPKTEIINKVNNLTFFNNEIANLHCRLTDNSKELNHKISWYDAKWNILQDNEIIDGATSNLLSIKLDSTKLKKYYCIVDGDCNSDTAEFKINYYKPIFPKSIAKTICEDSIINLKFLIIDANQGTFPPVTSSKIYNSNGEILYHHISQDKSEIKFETLEIMKKYKTGAYFCDISFGNEYYSFKILDLSIYEKTRLVSKSDDYIELKTGEDLNLNIQATGNIQSYDWYKEDSLILSSKDPNYLKKQITKIDAGKYYCKVKNFCQDSTFLISEIEIKDNSPYLSVLEFKSFKSKIIKIVDVQGREYNYNFSELLNNQLYFVIIQKDNSYNIYKFIKYE